MDYYYDSTWRIARELSDLNDILRRAYPPEELEFDEVYENLSLYELALLVYDNEHFIPWSIARHFRQKSIWELTGIHADEW